MTVLRCSFLALIFWGCPLVAQGAEKQPNWSKLLSGSDASLQTRWAVRYEHGQGVSQDYSRAVRLYCSAARKGNVKAPYRLGWLYANGRGVKRDDALAAAWFRVAAKRGSAPAKNMLSLLSKSKSKRAECVVPQSAGVRGRLVWAPPAVRRKIEKLVHRMAPEYGLDPKLVLAVVQIESGFDSKARSPKNAQGLMQLIPETAERFGVRDTMDPEQNLRGGMSYLRWLLAFFSSDLQLALAGYNAGERAVEKYRGVPAYPETQDYVARIIHLYGSSSHPPVAPVVKPSDVLASLAVR